MDLLWLKVDKIHMEHGLVARLMLRLIKVHIRQRQLRLFMPLTFQLTLVHPIRCCPIVLFVEMYHFHQRQQIHHYIPQPSFQLLGKYLHTLTWQLDASNHGHPISQSEREDFFDVTVVSSIWIKLKLLTHWAVNIHFYSYMYLKQVWALTTVVRSSVMRFNSINAMCTKLSLNG